MYTVRHYLSFIQSLSIVSQLKITFTVLNGAVSVERDVWRHPRLRIASIG